MRIVIDRVSKHYGAGEQRVAVLSDLSVTIESGACVALVGRSGSGKSTLLNLVGGLDDADSGRIVIGERTLSGLDDDGRTLFRREHIGFVFQFFNLLPTLTVAENVALPLELLQTDPRQRSGRVREILGAVGLAQVEKRLPEQLSGGEQQRVAIARALVHRPSVVLADEPTGNLDLETARQVITLLDTLCREKGVTLLMATHSPDVIGYADTVYEVGGAALTPAPLRS